MRVKVIFVQLPEFGGLVRFSSEELDDSHPCYPLLKEGIDAGEARANVAISIAHACAEPVGNRGYERNHDECRERQPPIHDEHRCADRDESEKVAES